jgi:Right handed beta helix region
MRLGTRLVGLAVVTAAVLMAASASASAATIDVFSGDSIQAAVNRANPGDVIVVHPGVYRQSVSIKKNHVTLKGAGDSNDGSVIRPGRKHRCGHGKVGICVLHHKNGHGGKSLTRDTRVSGFLIRGFKEFGAGAFGGKGTVFRDNTFVRNGSYGVTAFFSKRTKFLHNVAKDAGEAGFYIGDSQHANAVLRGNSARHNDHYGYLFRDSSDGLASNNRAVQNCLGIGLLNTGAPGGVRDWNVKRNHVVRNNQHCPGGDEGPPVSGTGIGLVGASHNAIRHNLAKGNRPKGSSAFPGGIVLVSSKSFGGSNSSRNTIARNRALKNKPDDVVWDGHGKGNRFNHNKCGSSQPAGLC